MDDKEQLSGESLFENAPCGLIVLSEDGLILRCNLMLCDWLGCDIASLNGRPFDQLLTVAGRTFFLTHWGPVIQAQGSVSEVKLDLRHRDGYLQSMLLNGVRRDTPDGIRFHLALFSTGQRDRNERAALTAMQRAEDLLSEKIHTEAALRITQRELAKAYDEAQTRAVLAEQMVAIASHDLKNPMTAIKMAVNLLEREAHSDRVRYLLSSIGGSAERAQRMIVDLLDFTSVRLGQGIRVRRQHVDLLKALDICVNELKIAFPNGCIRHLSRGVGTIELDQERLHQVVGNLVANSVAYGDLNYPITVTSDLSCEGVTLSVHNHGACIAESLIPTLFEPMTRGNDHQGFLPSVGLGLFIVKQIAQAHGGEISMSSNEVYGTTFTVYLPSVGTAV